ncbi:MAG: methyltransferase domain-containing protein [Planctomycetota bacterium]
MSARERRLRRQRDGGPPALAVAKPTRRGVFAKLARVVGVRRRIVVDGVRYTERGTERATERTTGATDRTIWEVRFPSGEAMLIHPEPGRVYPDLDPAAPRPVHRFLLGRVRPGMRVLDAACGTGAGAGVLADLVGPSGGVVAVCKDAEAVEFARRRYPARHVGFEVGGVETLEGEMEGAFHAVVAPRPVLTTGDPAGRLAELWRVVAPGGTLLVELDGGPSPDDASEALLERVCGVRIDVVSGPADAHAAVIVTRPPATDRPEADHKDEGPRPDEWRHTG